MSNCGHDFVVLGLVQRHQIGQRPRRDHDARGVHAGVAHQAFQLLRRIQQFPHLRIFRVGLMQLRRILQAPLRA